MSLNARDLGGLAEVFLLLASERFAHLYCSEYFEW